MLPGRTVHLQLDIMWLIGIWMSWADGDSGRVHPRCQGSSAAALHHSRARMRWYYDPGHASSRGRNIPEVRRPTPCRHTDRGTTPSLKTHSPNAIRHRDDLSYGAAACRLQPPAPIPHSSFPAHHSHRRESPKAHLASQPRPLPGAARAELRHSDVSRAGRCMSETRCCTGYYTPGAPRITQLNSAESSASFPGGVSASRRTICASPHGTIVATKPTFSIGDVSAAVRSITRDGDARTNCPLIPIRHV